MIELCSGCGRRATEEEQNCPACGRPLRDTHLGEQPPGWQLAPELTAPAVRPAHDDLPIHDASAASLDVAELFRARTPGDATALEDDPDSLEAIGLAYAGTMQRAPTGGRGWRVRATAAAQAGSAAAEPKAEPAPPEAARRAPLPHWVVTVLILSIIATSVAAVALVVAHVVRSSS